MSRKQSAMMMNKYFWQRFRTFFAVMMIPTIVFLVLILVFVGGRIDSTLAVQGENSLTGVRTNFDVVIKNAVYQQSLMSNDSQMMLSLKKLIQSGGNYDYSDSAFLSDYDTFLRSVIYSHSYIDSIYIYLDGYDDFFSSTENGVASLKTYYDTDWYKSYRSDTKLHYQWIVKRSINQYTYAPSVPVLTVFQRMSSGNGVIVININEAKLINILDSIATDRNEYLFMLDANGSMILSNQGDNGPAPAVQDGFFSKYLQANRPGIAALAGKWVSVGGRKYLVNVSNYAESQVYFVSLISESARKDQFSHFIVTFCLMFLANLVIVIVLAYLTTKRVFRQIDYMIQVFGMAENGKVSDIPPKHRPDEYDAIMNNVIHLFLKTTQMKNELTERQHSLEVAELTALQLQINPHFLLNTLQTMDLEALKLTHSPSSINEIIHDLSDILKYALGNPEEKVSLREEMDYLKEYVNIQKYRFGDKFLVYYEVPDALMDCRVFRLLLQPLLENSIVHGVRRLERRGYVKIKACRRGGALCFRVIDNGEGLTREQVAALYRQINDRHSRSIGLTNVNRRLILEYGDEYGLHILSKKNVGTSISFKIPLSGAKHPESQEMIPRGKKA